MAKVTSFCVPRSVLLIGTIVFAAYNGGAQARPMFVPPEDEQVRTWNQFVHDLIGLHERRIANRAIELEESLGGYELYPNFFRKVLYRDKKTGHLLADIQWEVAQPKRIHTAVLYFYNDKGQRVRDYSAMFLPWGRNSPIQTLVSFYHYQPGLVAFRKFDASGRTVYEDCKGDFKGKPVDIDLDEFDMARDELGVMKSAAYRQCFAALPMEPGKYLKPQ